MFDVTDFNELVKKLDRRNRVLVLEVSRRDDGQETPALWIATAKDPLLKLMHVDSDLVGRAILSDLLTRGPDPNTWSHHKRLAANKRLVASAEIKAAAFIRRNLMVNKAVGLLAIVLLLAVIATLTMIEVMRPDTGDGRPVIIQQGEKLVEEKDAILCYPRGSAACVKTSN